MKVRLFVLAACICLSSTPRVSNAQDDVFQWLERMGAAMNQMNYQGTFVYVQGGSVETVRITHMVTDQGSQERLASVSGKPSEVVRDAEGVRWISGENHTLMADSSASRPFFPELPMGDISNAAKSYQFSLENEERIASHLAQQIDITPRDNYRYGYRLWLEVQSGLLLKWELLDTKGKTLAKLMFTDLRMGSEVDPAELASSDVSASNMTASNSAPTASRLSKTKPAWSAQQVPPGFRLATYRGSVADARTGLVSEHLVYSDGIVAVSVYVESSDENTQLEPGMSRMGTTHAFTRSVNKDIVTVLGDVPAETVRMIGESVQLSSQ